MVLFNFESVFCIQNMDGMIVEALRGGTLLRFSGEGVAGWDALGSAGLGWLWGCGAV